MCKFIAYARIYVLHWNLDPALCYGFYIGDSIPNVRQAIVICGTAFATLFATNLDRHQIANCFYVLFLILHHFSSHCKFCNFTRCVQTINKSFGLPITYTPVLHMAFFNSA